MQIDLVGLLEGHLGVVSGEGPDHPGPRVFGVVTGVVTSVTDPQAIGRVRVCFPTIADQTESAWARVVVPWAGPAGRGAYFLPAVDDEVLIAFRDGDLGHPYVLGFLWSQPSPPPQPNPPAPPNPLAQLSELRSASGHSLAFVDLPGSGAVTLRTGGGYQIRLSDSSDGAGITITDPAGTLSIALDSASGSITLSAPNQISLSAPSINLAPPSGPTGDFPSGAGTTSPA